MWIILHLVMRKLSGQKRIAKMVPGEITQKRALRFVGLARGPNDRTARKAIVFPVLYGTSPERVSEALEISVDTARLLIKDYESILKVAIRDVKV